MFVRRRIKRLKDGETAVYFQAVHSYRRNGKVVQKVASLGKNPNITEVLNEELRFLQRMKKDLAVPTNEYKEIRWKAGLGLVMLAIPVKVAERRRAKLMERYRKQLDRVARIESLNSRTK